MPNLAKGGGKQSPAPGWEDGREVTEVGAECRGPGSLEGGLSAGHPPTREHARRRQCPPGLEGSPAGARGGRE